MIMIIYYSSLDAMLAALNTSKLLFLRCFMDKILCSNFNIMRGVLFFML